jgi:LysR family hydrogen peroxide-inducible transcriptional activator
MIERYLIHYFLAVVDQGTFSKAAQRCGVSQPTLSVGIAKLEGHVGHVLFHRTNRRVELTAAGVRFASHARRIEAEFARAQAAMAESDRSRLIRLGVISSLPSAWLEAAARQACESPGERLEIVEGRMRDLLPRLERGRIDAIIGVLGNDPRERETLFEEGYALAMAADHVLAGRAALEPEQVASAHMIVRRNCEALPAVSRFFTQHGVRPFFSARTVNDDRAVGFVRAGLGITVMPQCFAQDGIAMPLLSGFDQRRRISLLADPATAGRVEGSPAIAGFCASIRRSAGVSQRMQPA